MKWKALLALAIVFAFSSPPLRAQDDGMPSRAKGDTPQTGAQGGDAAEDSFNAQALKDACAPAPAASQNARALADRTCQSYLRGLTEGLFLQTILESSDAADCLPKDGPISPSDAKANFLSYLAENPGAADHEAGAAAVLAIVRAHGCGKD